MGPDRPITAPGPPQPVFCDDSGMTGNDLLDPNQAAWRGRLAGPPSGAA
jgi:hypothetical protein